MTITKLFFSYMALVGIATGAIVVKAAPGEVDLRCGGVPMALIEEVPDAGGSPAPGFDTGTQLGKRYVIPRAELLRVLGLVEPDGAGSAVEGQASAAAPAPVSRPHNANVVPGGRR